MTKWVNEEMIKWVNAVNESKWLNHLMSKWVKE